MENIYSWSRIQAGEKKQKNRSLWPDEVQFGLAASTTSQLHIVPIAVNVGALLDVWPIMGGYGGIQN